MKRWVDFARGRALLGPSPVARRARSRTTPPRAVPLGQRLALRRVARARRRHGQRLPPPSRGGPRPGRHRLPLPIGPRARRASLACSATGNGAAATTTSPPTWSTRGARSSSTTTATSNRRRRRTSFAPSRSVSSPTTSASRPPTTSSHLIRAAGTHLGDRVPGDALPAAGARRPRPSRRRLRAAVPGHRAVVAAHDRERRDDHLGGLGRGQARRHRVALAQPLQQGRGHLRSCTATSPGCNWWSPAIAGSASHHTRAEASRGRRHTTTVRTVASTCDGNNATIGWTFPCRCPRRRRQRFFSPTATRTPSDQDATRCPRNTPMAGAPPSCIDSASRRANARW